MKDADFLSGLILVIFALVGFFEAGYIPYLKNQALSAAFYPKLLFGVIMLCGLGLIYQGWRRSKKFKFPNFHWGKLIPLFGVLLAYAFTLEYFGFIATTLVFTVVCMLLLGERKIVLLGVVPVVSTFGIYYLFSKVFMIVLP